MNTLLNFFNGGLAIKINLCCFLLIGFLVKNTFAQSCSGMIGGIVSDQNNQVLAGVEVQLSGEKTINFITDTSGRFDFGHLCPGNYTLVLKAMGFKNYTQKLTLETNISGLKIGLKENVEQLSAIEVKAQKPAAVNTVAHSELTNNDLTKYQGEGLGQMLKQVSGVSVTQSGPTLSKPTIHGLTGNRILIVNNGVRQEGQQWGDDHAPELDPNTANSITVVKGAASIRYGSDAIAGVVLMNPAPLPVDQGISGNISLVGNMNGRRGTVSGELEGAFGKSLKGLSWRLQGTLQRAGNF